MLAATEKMTRWAKVIAVRFISDMNRKKILENSVLIMYLMLIPFIITSYFPNIY